MNWKHFFILVICLSLIGCSGASSQNHTTDDIDRDFYKEVYNSTLDQAQNTPELYFNLTHQTSEYRVNSTNETPLSRFERTRIYKIDDSNKRYKSTVIWRNMSGGAYDIKFVEQSDKYSLFVKNRTRSNVSPRLNHTNQPYVDPRESKSSHLSVESDVRLAIDACFGIRHSDLYSQGTRIETPDNLVQNDTSLILYYNSTEKESAYSQRRVVLDDQLRLTDCTFKSSGRTDTTRTSQFAKVTIRTSVSEISRPDWTYGLNSTG
jgi:hypothetical protein